MSQDHEAETGGRRPWPGRWWRTPSPAPPSPSPPSASPPPPPSHPLPPQSLPPVLAGYRPAFLFADARAALMLAALALPEQMATARLIGLPDSAGLIAFAAGTLGFAAFGSSRFVSVGADSTVAPILAGGLATLAVAGSPHYAAMAAMVAAMTGLILLGAFVFRLGWLADLLSVPMTTGFLAGVGVHIVAAQLPDALGLAATSGGLAARLAGIASRMPEASVPAAAMTAVVVLTGLGAERFDRRLPGPLIGIVACALAVWVLGLDRGSVAMLGVPHWQGFGVHVAWLDDTQILHLLPIAAMVALLCMMQTAAVVQAYSGEDDWRATVARAFAAVGVGNLLAAVCGGFPVNASPPRTAVARAGGARSQLSALMAAGLTLAVAALAGESLRYVPRAALAGLLIVVAIRMIRLDVIRRILRESRHEALLVIASAALVIALPIEIGVAMSILLSVLLSIAGMARPPSVELLRVPGTTVWWSLDASEAGEREPGVLVFSLGAPLTFINSGFMLARLMQAVAARGPACRLVVLEASGVIAIDFTGAQLAAETITRLRRRGIDIALARLESDRARHSAAQTGLIGLIGANHVFRSVEEAVRTLARRDAQDARQSPEASTP